MNDSDFVNCPIVPSHRMLKHRLNLHLIRCRFRQQQMLTRLQGTSTAATGAEELATTGVQSTQVQASAGEEHHEENWDDSSDWGTYEPQPPAAFRNPPPFLSRNERKRWRLEQRAKF